MPWRHSPVRLASRPVRRVKPDPAGVSMMRDALSFSPRCAAMRACNATRPYVSGQSSTVLARRLASAQRRHHDFLAAAGPPLRSLAAAERELLAHADADLAQALPVAADRDRAGGETRIGVDEGLLDLGRRDRERRL